VLELVFRVDRFIHFYLLNYILSVYKYLACVCDNMCFADKLTFFCCFSCSADFYDVLQCIIFFSLPFFFQTNIIKINLIIQ